MTRLIFAVIVFAATQFSSPASARIDRWSAHVDGDRVFVTDCSDCGDDVGVIVSCQGDRAAAKLSVPFQAREADPLAGGEPATLLFVIDDDSFELPVAFEEWGMVGFVPVISLARSTPVVTAIRFGRALDIELDNRKISFGLKGSAAALALFDNNCAWGDEVEGVQGGGIKTSD